MSPATSVALTALATSMLAAAALTAPAHAAEKPDPTKTYVVTCQGQLEYKPKEIVFACGDGGVYFGNIRWSSWTQNGAKGTGTLYFNTCEPTCGAGNIQKFPKTKLTLGGVATGPAMGTMVNTFSTITGTFGKYSGPAMAESATWAIDNVIED